MFTSSETIDLQLVDDNLDEDSRSELVKQILDLQHQVLSDMLVMQQQLYDERLEDWTQEGKAAWDQLLALDIDAREHNPSLLPTYPFFTSLE